MPGPVIFGAIIDKTCTLWKYTCGERQSCFLYDIVYFRNALHTYGVVSSVLATLLLSSLYFYFRWKGQTDWGGQGGEDKSAWKEMGPVNVKNGKVNVLFHTHLCESD